MESHDPDDDASPAPLAGDAEQKPVDLRFTKTEQSGVRIDRDLSGQGHLARGSHTNMSSMRFSVRAQPRQELDPELQALRPHAPAPAQRSEPSGMPTAASERPPDAVAPPGDLPAASAPAPDEGSGMMAAIKRFFT